MVVVKSEHPHGVGSSVSILVMVVWTISHGTVVVSRTRYNITVTEHHELVVELDSDDEASDDDCVSEDAAL